jgi:hypothetical protein
MALPREHLMDELATAYVQALVATAGATMAVSRLDYGIDGTIRQIVRVTQKESGRQRFIPSGFPIDFQLKGTSTGFQSGGFINYDLKARNYDIIVRRKAQETPFYLFLVCFSSESDRWLELGSERLILNASAFWWRDHSDETKNSTTVRLRIPASNRLTSDAMFSLFKSPQDRSSLQ